VNTVRCKQLVRFWTTGWQRSQMFIQTKHCYYQESFSARTKEQAGSAQKD